jgi:predicted AAA+ superfamily ATPase
MTYINRDLEEKIKSASKEYACILITGARQVGKSTVLKKLMDDNREEVLLDDIEERKLASKDPALFLQMHSLPILIDEVQYAPELFSYIKMAIKGRKNIADKALAMMGRKKFDVWMKVR